MKPSPNGNADACTWFETAALSPPSGGSLKRDRNNEVSVLFDSEGHQAVQTTAQAVTGRFRCLTVVVPAFPMVSVIPAPE
ncbi:hypothetical protein EDE08_10313 [Bradyrhizobium sp. R2.2-H]|nr:hypothetical protein EDE10_10312 [Bradyrhizobium sp. Y-H1]TCU77566.1 hypothetical protein EDE08_10313 [Bradyrhizobium sp. R2.2-H]